MLLEFSITNFRSIKDRQIFSMLGSSKIKERFNAPFVLEQYKNMEVLKTAVLYGKNNAGKSNVLKALGALKWLVTKSKDLEIGATIKNKDIDIFLFDKQTLNQSTVFEIDFIGNNQIYYRYEVEFSKKDIIKEKLSFYQQNAKKFKTTEIFSREKSTISYRKDLKENEKNTLESIAQSMLDNQLFLSLSATKRINEHFENAYLFFSQKIKLRIFEDEKYEEENTVDVPAILLANPLAKRTIESLLIAADTGILGIDIKENNLSSTNFNFPDDIDEDIKNRVIKNFIKKFKYEVKIQHRMFDGVSEIAPILMPLQIESLGTKKMFTLGAIIHEVMQNGEVLIVDELDKSLHPLLTDMLVSLFYDEQINFNNAQLIFSTHDATLIDAYLFDKDQVNIIDKDYFGKTEISTISDFKGIRQEVPIGKWFLAGRLGGVPKIDTSFIHFEFKNKNGEDEEK